MQQRTRQDEAFIPEIKQLQPLVERLAKRLRTRLPAHIELNDLMQEGFIGAMQACESFDPNAGVKLETYASHRILGAMMDHLRVEDYLTKNMREKVGRMQKAERRLGDELGRAPTHRELAVELSWTPAELVKLRDIQQGIFVRLDTKDGEDHHALLASLADTRIRPAESMIRVEQLQKHHREFRDTILPKMKRAQSVKTGIFNAELEMLNKCVDHVCEEAATEEATTSQCDGNLRGAELWLRVLQLIVDEEEDMERASWHAIGEAIGYSLPRNLPRALKSCLDWLEKNYPGWLADFYELCIPFSRDVAWKLKTKTKPVSKKEAISVKAQ